MKKNWLRGLLLGASMALLLGGGVALAALRISVDPWCGVCCDQLPPIQPQQLWGCDEFWTFTTSGWGESESLHFSFSSPSSPVPEFGLGADADENGRMVLRLYLFCYRGDNAFQTLGDGYDHAAGFAREWTEDDYGVWDVLLEGDSGAVEADFYFAEDAGVCRAREFVPEPGSILLLGSGLAGLAGYAALRWRARE